MAAPKAQTLEQLAARLEAYEAAGQKAEERARKAEAKAEKLERELKETKAQTRNLVTEANAEMNRLRTMRDLTGGKESPYAEDNRTKYEEMKAATVKTRDGMAHYYVPVASMVGNTYVVADSFIAIPKEQDPSVQWLPVENAGKDAKTGKLLFRPVGVVKDVANLNDPAHQVDEDETPTNTELNERAARKQREEAERLGIKQADAVVHDQGEEPNKDELPTRASDTQVG